MFDLATFAIIAATLLLAGAVKGVIGLGLPTVTLALLAVVIDLPDAMALLLVPTFCTNVLQALSGRGAKRLLRRLWPFFLFSTLAIWFGVKALTMVALPLLSGLLGGLLVLYAAMHLAGWSLSAPPRHERLIGGLLGVVNGLLTGMTGSAVVPGVLFLQSVGLSRDELVKAMGMLFAASATALAVALQRHSILTWELGVISACALPPALVGMWAGRKVRARLSEQVFRKVFFQALLILGAYIILDAFMKSMT